MLRRLFDAFFGATMLQAKHGDLIVVTNVKVKGQMGEMTINGPTWQVM
jgi:hypothetical protein